MYMYVRLTRKLEYWTSRAFSQNLVLNSFTIFRLLNNSLIFKLSCNTYAKFLAAGVLHFLHSSSIFIQKKTTVFTTIQCFYSFYKYINQKLYFGKFDIHTRLSQNTEIIINNIIDNQHVVYKIHLTDILRLLREYCSANK